MKSAFIIIFLMITVMNVIAWDVLPDQVAVHFGQGGQPNGWASKDSNFFIMQGLYVFLFLMFYYTPVLVFKTPSQWISLPNRDFWLSPENIEITKQKITNAMYEFGIYMFLFFGVIGYLTTQANQNPPVRLDESRFMIGLIAFFGLTAYWTVKFILAFRLPKNDSPGIPKV